MYDPEAELDGGDDDDDGDVPRVPLGKMSADRAIVGAAAAQRAATAAAAAGSDLHHQAPSGAVLKRQEPATAASGLQQREPAIGGGADGSADAVSDEGDGSPDAVPFLMLLGRKLGVTRVQSISRRRDPYSTLGTSVRCSDTCAHMYMPYLVEGFTCALVLATLSSAELVPPCCMLHHAYSVRSSSRATLPIRSRCDGPAWLRLHLRHDDEQYCCGFTVGAERSTSSYDSCMISVLRGYG